MILRFMGCTVYVKGVPQRQLIVESQTDSSSVMGGGGLKEQKMAMWRIP